ncbi:MAG: phosphatidylglycerophosphatase A [Candidatus Coatesbacteria bacterium]|nr:phosphatidylglycerophosphatase A [Candidatus Coatesbacteria bacterium]
MKSQSFPADHDSPDAKCSGWDSLAKTLATFFWVGQVPFASGTFGTVPGLFIYVLAALLGLPLWGYLMMTALLFAIGVWAAGRAEKLFGKKDDGRIVVDEVVGALVTMFYIPLDWRLVIAGFLAFRFFDVVKPGIRKVERVKGGFGVMLDDVLAGILANISLWLLLLLIAAFR